MPINNLTDNNSIRSNTGAQASATSIGGKIFKIDLTPIYEVESDAIVALDGLVLNDIDDAPSLATPVPADSYVDRQRAYCAALDAERAAADRAIHFAPLHDSFSTEESARIRREVEAQADDLLSDLDDIHFDDDEPAPAIVEHYARPDWAGIYADKRLKSDPRTIRQENLFKEASLRIAAAKAANALRIQDAERKRTSRASPAALRAKRLKALLKATAAPRGDKRLEQLRGREEALILFHDATNIKAGASLREIGGFYEMFTGERMTKFQARKRRDIVKELEAPGGIWARYK
jgi:hypothetical protein